MNQKLPPAFQEIMSKNLRYIKTITKSFIHEDYPEIDSNFKIE